MIWVKSNTLWSVWAITLVLDFYKMSIQSKVMEKIVKLLAIDTGSTELKVTRHEIPASESQKLKDTILTSLNEMGKSSHVLISYNGKLYTAHHTAARGPSSEYFRSEVRYHPMAAQLA